MLDFVDTTAGHDVHSATEDQDQQNALKHKW